MSSESDFSADEDEWEPTEADVLECESSNTEEEENEAPKSTSRKKSRPTAAKPSLAKSRSSGKRRSEFKPCSVAKPSSAKSSVKIQSPMMKSSYFESEDSSSSSNEFEKAPESLNDLSDFDPMTSAVGAKVSGSSDQKTAVEIGQEESHESSRSGQVEYYDFSSILKSQAELKTVADQMENYSSECKNKDPSILDVRTEQRGRAKKRSRESVTENRSPKKTEIEQLLKMGEKNEDSRQKRRRKKGKKEDIDDDMVVVSEIDESDIEESTIANQDVEVTIKLPSKYLARKNAAALRLQTEAARHFNESRRKLQVLLHKVSLLGYLAHGNHINNLANSDEIQALALSIVPSKNFYPSGPTTVSYIEKLAKWFNKHYHLKNTDTKISPEILIDDFEKQKASNVTSLTIMFTAMCRQLGTKCRLIMSLQPCPLKPPSSEMIKLPKVPNDSDSDSLSDTPAKKSKPCPANGKRNSKSDKTKAGSKSKSKESSTGKSSKSSLKKPNRKVLSTEESEEETAAQDAVKKGVDLWTEIYDESDERWIPTDVARGQVNNASATGNGVTKPLAYVVGWNADGSLKDLTRRYASQWLTTTPKLRVDSSWWKETLRPWAPSNTKIERVENKKLDEEVAASPIPTSISECKNHPFYALKRHLLKFEAIFPPNAQPIGFIRGEAVYSRVCVTTLHTKETWMREAKTVRLGEEPYKVVKARPKYDKGTGAVIKDLPLPLFGYWQVEDYIPPIAVNGKVPRNEFGNVELYRPSMLPSGTVHLQVPGIAKVAKKMGIDCAPAVVGWEFHSGGSHPAFDGVVVCEEFQDILLDAWNVAIDEEADKRKQKSRARAIKNWKILIRSVIIRKRLEKRCKIDLSNVKAI